jgi:(2Fe-2S) ferredoxin
MPFAPGKMPPVRHQVFVCTADPCAGRGAEATYKALRRKVKATPGLEGVWVNRSGSVGGCEHGPLVVIYPEGVWYHGVTVDKVDTLVERHLIRGEEITEWRFHRTEGCPCIEGIQGIDRAGGETPP